MTDGLIALVVLGILVGIGIAWQIGRAPSQLHKGDWLGESNQR